MTCVRLKGETNFNSQLSFHLNTYKQAMEFVELLKYIIIKRINI